MVDVHQHLSPALTMDFESAGGMFVNTPKNPKGTKLADVGFDVGNLFARNGTQAASADVVIPRRVPLPPFDEPNPLRYHSITNLVRAPQQAVV
jgi:hypothetical protein